LLQKYTFFYNTSNIVKNIKNIIVKNIKNIYFYSMLNISTFSSRESKKTFLNKIISKLSIHWEEKELYILCLEVLENKEFDIFFEKIFSQVSQNENIPDKRIIEPFTATLF